MPELKRSPLLVIGREVTDDMIHPENMKLLKKYIRDMQMRGLSERTIYSYTCDIKAWFRYIYQEQFNQSVKELTEDDIEEMIFMCKEHGNHAERLKRRMSSISAFYKFLKRKKEVTENITENISRPKKGLPVVVQTFLSKEQWGEMKKRLYQTGDLQLIAYVLLSMTTMARVAAISSIQWKQIDFENRTIDDVLEKEGKIVTLFFNEEAKKALLKLKKMREDENIDSEYVFISKYNGKYRNVSTNTMSEWAGKAGALIGIKTFSPHDFRHSGATLLKNAGMPLEEVSVLLNHASVDVTRQFYIKEDKTKIGKNKDKYELQETR